MFESKALQTPCVLVLLARLARLTYQMVAADSLPAASTGLLLRAGTCHVSRRLVVRSQLQFPATTSYPSEWTIHDK